MPDITIHSVVRNEPFIYYAIKSVYSFASKILLYDTGSYDKHTLEDINTLIKEDHYHKIDFKEIEIDIDETKWTENNLLEMIKRNKGKKGVGYVRKLQISDTRTEYFMIVDGDEVHYNGVGPKIYHLLTHWPQGKICAFLPLIWFGDIKGTLYNVYQYSGRVFKTKDVGMNSDSPNEIHTNKHTNEILHVNSPYIFYAHNIKSFAHFELLLKPFRRDKNKYKIIARNYPLPEIMNANKYYLERFLNENNKR